SLIDDGWQLDARLLLASHSLSRNRWFPAEVESLVAVWPFFFNGPPTTEIYTLSLHDALPIFLYRNLVLPGHHVYKRILAGTVCILGCLTIGAFVTQDDRRIENRGAARVGDGSNYSP